jgi:hypothetical protein
MPGEEIVIERLAEALRAGDEESVTVTLKLVVPAVVGVPEITPPELRVSPAGSDEPEASAHV